MYLNLCQSTREGSALAAIFDASEKLSRPNLVITFYWGEKGEISRGRRRKVIPYFAIKEHIRHGINHILREGEFVPVARIECLFDGIPKSSQSIEFFEHPPIDHVSTVRTVLERQLLK